MDEVIFNNSIIIDRYNLLKYTIKYTDIKDTPTALVLECFLLDSGEYLECAQKYEGTLYVDSNGRIVDRAPMIPGKSARCLQQIYAEAIKKDLEVQFTDNGTTALEAVYPLISGFFLGEAGIDRVQYFRTRRLSITSCEAEKQK